MKKKTTKSNESPYSKVFGHKAFKNSTGSSANQLLGFTALYDTESNWMNKEELLDKIAQLSPAPHNIFSDKEGYLLRFELDKPIDIEDEGHENKLKKSILNFLEESHVAIASLQEMEVGRWEAHLVLLDDDGEVIEWLQV